MLQYIDAACRAGVRGLQASLKHSSMLGLVLVFVLDPEVPIQYQADMPLMSIQDVSREVVLYLGAWCQRVDGHGVVRHGVRSRRFSLDNTGWVEGYRDVRSSRQYCLAEVVECRSESVLPCIHRTVYRQAASCLDANRVNKYLIRLLSGSLCWLIFLRFYATQYRPDIQYQHYYQPALRYTTSCDNLLSSASATVSCVFLWSQSHSHHNA